MEAAKAEVETVLREVWEETGLCVRILPGFQYLDTYPLPQDAQVIRQIAYFLAEFSG